MKIFDLATLSPEELNSLPAELKKESKGASGIAVRVLDIIQKHPPAVNFAYIRAKYYLLHRTALKKEVLITVLSALYRKGEIKKIERGVFAPRSGLSKD